MEPSSNSFLWLLERMLLTDLGESVSDEGFHYLSPLLSGQSLLQQFLLSHLFHPNVSPTLVQKLYKRRASGLVVKKKHLERAEGQQQDIQGTFLCRSLGTP